MDITEQVERIKNKNDFINFLDLLNEDLRDHRDTWDNVTLESFLDGLYGFCLTLKIDEPTWKDVGNMLLAASIYE